VSVPDRIAALSPVWRMGVLVLAVLVLATLVTAALGRLRPAWELAEVRARIRAWWGMAAVFFGAVAVEPRLSFLFFALVSTWALREYLRILRDRPASRGALALAFLAVPLQYLWAAIGWYGMFVLWVPLYVFLLLPLWLVRRGETDGFVAATSTVHWGLMAFVFGLSHAALLLGLPESDLGGASGRSLLLFLVFVVEMSDVLQFLWGKSLGRRKILPRVSPNKTWEGLIGGVATSMILALAIRFLTPFSTGETLGVTLLVTLAGFAGGAVMSAVKRDFGVKDFGTAGPGHGGVLDRVDSLCWAAPVFLHYVRFFHSS
jgi:phosphatidate cytidylyltransferase